MPVVSLAPMLRTASAGGYAVAQFNTDTVEIAQSIIRVAVEEHAPVILALGQGVDKAGRLEPVAAAIRALATAAPVPVCLHLDHSESLSQIARALRAGFSGVMFDASARPLDQNVRVTLQVLELCRELHVGVEAELGRIPGVEDGLVVSDAEGGSVSLEIVAAFLSEVRPDALAVAVGTAHGLYNLEPQIDFALIEQLKATHCPPLVLHGGSGLSDELLALAVRCGIAKINFATELRRAFVSAVTSSRDDVGIFEVLADGADKAAEVARKKLHVTGSAGKGDLVSWT